MYSSKKKNTHLFPQKYSNFIPSDSRLILKHRHIAYLVYFVQLYPKPDITGYNKAVYAYNATVRVHRFCVNRC